MNYIGVDRGFRMDNIYTLTCVSLPCLTCYCSRVTISLTWFSVIFKVFPYRWDSFPLDVSITPNIFIICYRFILLSYFPTPTSPLPKFVYRSQMRIFEFINSITQIRDTNDHKNFTIFVNGVEFATEKIANRQTHGQIYFCLRNVCFYSILNSQLQRVMSTLIYPKCICRRW